jgi:glucan biosynthesis protein|tara:strand:+ start:3163 stop:3408 length:246 start_codon:yes stop_codon:yes gene_type:complete
MSIENENPDLLKPVQSENEMKKWLVNYVGQKLNPENDEVNVEMIIQVMASEFPEFLLAIAEENFIRGYRQGLTDADKEVAA